MKHLLDRILGGAVVLWIVATTTFALMHVIPGGPFDRDRVLPPEILANVEAKYRLDEPVARQYVHYIAGLLRGDLGPSYKYPGRTVAGILRDTFPVSIELGVIALLLAATMGITTGVVSAARSRPGLDRTSLIASTVGISLPSFVLGSLLVFIFSQSLRWLPPALWEGWRSVVLPSAALAAAPAAYIAGLVRSNMLDTLRQDHIRTAKAKGMAPSSVLLKHGLKNSLGPTLSYLGPLTAQLVTGSFVIEYLFSIPGMGRFFVTAVTNRDYPLIMGTTLIYAALIIAVNAAVDFLYAALDPRVRES